MPHFFKDKPIERLVGEGIEAEHLNDDTLRRALDAPYTYGPETVYCQLAAQTIRVVLRNRPYRQYQRSC